jgi:hypothetical protein
MRWYRSRCRRSISFPLLASTEKRDPFLSRKRSSRSPALAV